MEQHRIIRLYREVEVGDLVYVDNPTRFSDANEGQVLRVTSIESYDGTMIWAYNKRMGKSIILHDSEYFVCAKETRRYLGTEVVTKKFLGITYKREENEIWEVVK